MILRSAFFPLLVRSYLFTAWQVANSGGTMNKRGTGHERHKRILPTMFVVAKSVSSTKRRWTFWSHLLEAGRDHYNTLGAVILFFIAQLLTCAWDQPFWSAGLDFPGQVIAMLFVWIVMWGSQVLLCKDGEGLERFYHRYLRGPTEILNKHMSIGFTVPFMDLIRHSFPGKDQIGLLTAAFVATGVLNSILVYITAYHLQLVVTKVTSRSRHHNVFDVEAPEPQPKMKPSTPRPSSCSQPSIGLHGHLREGILGEDDGNVTPRLECFQKHISDVSTLCTLTGYVSDSNEPKQAYLEGRRGMSTQEHMREENMDDMQPSSCMLGPTRTSGASSLASQLGKVPKAIRSWMLQNVFLVLSLLLFLLVGLPVSIRRHNDLFLDVGFLFTVWLTFTSAQTHTKQHIRPGNRQYKKTLTAISTLLNPVLWSSLFLVAYGLAKSSIRDQDVSEVVARFTTNNTVSDIIGHHIDSLNPAPSGLSHLGEIPIGAGDIATSILNAGIVSWGLRLFEYRHQIISRGGITVIVTSVLASLFNVVAWPLLANKMGVHPASSDLSFAARSVTIALGGPAMKSLGGDVGVNAVGVVVNGICFQLVAGLLVGGIKVEGLGGVLRECQDLLSHDGLVWNGIWTTRRGESSDASGSESPSSTERGRSLFGEETRQQDHERVHDREVSREVQHSSVATQENCQQPPQPLQPPRVHNGQGILLPPRNTDYHSSNFSIGLPEGISSSRENQECVSTFTHGHEPGHDDVSTVAAGVTVGINAAAMGTAHLYEQNSHVAPYSALSMTTFGVFTVLFAVKSPLTEWLVRTVSES